MPQNAGRQSCGNACELPSVNYVFGWNVVSGRDAVSTPAQPLPAGTAPLLPAEWD
jgi:hypothetical protein